MNIFIFAPRFAKDPLFDARAIYMCQIVRHLLIINFNNIKNWYSLFLSFKNLLFGSSKHVIIKYYLNKQNSLY